MPQPHPSTTIATKIATTLLAASALLSGCAGAGGGAATPTPAPAAEPETLQVVADARVLPARSADLRFLTSGTIAEILVAEGDSVASGAPLARLDTRELELAVSQAEAGLAEATARYEQISQGASPAEIAAAEAAVAQAQADAREVGGSVSPQDLAAAQAEVQQARARLASLTGRPNADALARAQAAATQAQAELDRQRSALSAAKEQARQDVEAAANRLRDAQAAFATARDNLSSVEQDGKDPLTGVSLTDAGERAFRDAYAQAERAMRDAEAALGQARVSYEDARQREITGLADAEARLSAAQADLAALTKPNADTLAAARAGLAQAEANLDRLSGEQRAGQIEAAAARVAQAQANLEKITAGARSAELALAQTQIDGSKVALRQAELALDRATLRAPFAGTIFAINLEVGELPPADQPALVIADISAWHLETSDLTELDVVAVRPGDPVTITFDAIPDLSLAGAVTRVKGLGQSFQGDVIYTVVIKPASWDERLRWNMTATVAIGE